MVLSRLTSLPAVGLLIICSLTSTGLKAQNIIINGEFATLQADVTSWYDLRHRQLVRQQWDISCGAAALSTLLTWYFGLPLNEETVARALLQTTRVTRVQARGGFSLLDLKRFVEAIGMRGEGYAEMSLEDLQAMNQPAIIPVSLYGLDHFVVYRGQLAEQVFIGDPAFGNLSLSADQFNAVWNSRIAFFVSDDVERDFSQHSFHVQPQDLNLLALQRFSWDYAAPLEPLTRRTRTLSQ